MCHTSMPSIARGQLLGGCEIEEQVSQGCLKGIEGKIQNIEADDRDSNGQILDLY